MIFNCRNNSISPQCKLLFRDRSIIANNLTRLMAVVANSIPPYTWATRDDIPSLFMRADGFTGHAYTYIFKPN
ncbi:hypothetical protein D3878_00150 [Noviherbaspirillum sedimenti]|uniref:Uncharacterized protein n=1 Tax=Noviherbaspirillum sedimenti TaxID=2320865 RepID=A0A3A3FXT4_9BURK|nr:hypothetical protein D3878_00150 [Noviherbaspirillum sedimenti]